MGKRPPLHFLFAEDRALRDGDWKLVSFQSQPWELYNMANDRTELHNLSAKQPERVEAMSAMWFDMAKNVLEAPKKFLKPNASKAGEQMHWEWADDQNSPVMTNKKKKKKKSKK